MFKKLPLALMMGTLLTASSAFALGVGDIKVNSALNQRLDAEIELLSSIEGELDDVTVSLASQEAFERIRLARPYHLTDIKFKVTTRADGTPVVKLSTPENIREPFLDFLVEVSWPKGRMLREYTVLLDPPVTMASQPQPGSTSSSSSGAETIAYVPDPGESSTPDVSSADSSSYSAPSYSGDTYGPIADQETLWSIANQVKSGDVSTQQMMLALFDANPEAFIDGDIHHVRKGAVLRIPASSDVNVRDYADAMAEVRQLNENLDLTATSEQAGIPEAMVDVETSSAPTESTTAPQQQDELSIVAPSNASSAGTGSSTEDLDALKRELALATETMSSQKLENEELKSRIQELEGAVAEMDKLKRLLELQNEEMARLQGQMSDVGSVAESAVEPVVEQVVEEQQPEIQPEPVEEQVAESMAEAEPDPAPAEPAPRPAPLPPPAQKEPMDVAMDYINKVRNDPTLLGIVAAVVLVLIALVVLVLRRRKSVDAPVEEVAEADLPEADDDNFTMEVVDEGESDDGKSSKKKFALAGLGGAALFAGLKDKFKFGKKKTADDIGVEEGDSDDVTDQNFGAEEDAAALTGDEATVFEAPESEAEPSFDDMMFEEDDASSSDAGFDPAATTVGDPEPAAPAEPEGPDPLEEVDVYEAFGDFEQAAEIVKQAIAEQPDNNSFKLRLFKVYQNGGMSSEFSDDAVAYKGDLDGSSEWDEIVSMGQSFAPDCPAWSGGGVSEAAPAADAGSMSETVAEAPAEASAADDAGVDFGDLDFELGDAGGDTPAAEPEPAAETPASDSGGDSLEFDLGDLDFEPAGSANAPSDNTPTAEPTADDSVDNSMEFNLGDLDFETPGDDAPAAPAESADEAAVDNSMEFDLGDMDFESADSAAEEAPVEDAGADDMTLDADLGLDFELNEPSAEAEGGDFKEGSETVELDVSADELMAQASESSDVPDSEDPTILFPEGDAPAGDGADVSMGVDLSDFSFDIDESGNADALDMGDDSSSESGDFLADADEALSAIPDGPDEVGTKLDLARAYIDMGDADGAKNILQEVVAEGNDAQKQDAEELLKNT